jgi:hypothetical protein
MSEAKEIVAWIRDRARTVEQHHITKHGNDSRFTPSFDVELIRKLADEIEHKFVLADDLRKLTAVPPRPMEGVTIVKPYKRKSGRRAARQT